jgi:hypothetical protein
VHHGEDRVKSREEVKKPTDTVEKKVEAPIEIKNDPAPKVPAPTRALDLDLNSPPQG